MPGGRSASITGGDEIKKRKFVSHVCAERVHTGCSAESAATRKIRQGRQIVVSLRHAAMRGLTRQSTRSDERSAVMARELTTSAATERPPETLASREASTYRITPCGPIAKVGRKFLTSASSTIAMR